MTKNHLNIILVEDDLNLGFLLSEYLEGRGVKVKLYRDGKSALEGYKQGNYNFCLFDVMLPEMDGFTLAKHIRMLNENIPIVFLTARGMKEDKIKGYDIGADDYITKPFDEDELWCKISAISKRISGMVEKPEKIAKIGGYEFDFENLSLKIGDSVKRLTTREAEVLQLLCRTKGKVVRREDILTKIWGENDYFAGRSLDVFISKLRKYFAEDTSVSIENVVKVGYILNC